MQVLKENFKEALKLVACHYFELDLRGTPLQQIRVLEDSKYSIDWSMFMPLESKLIKNFIYWKFTPNFSYGIDNDSVLTVMRRVFGAKKSKREAMYTEGRTIKSDTSGLQDRIRYIAEIMLQDNIDTDETRGALDRNDLKLLEDHEHIIKRVMLSIANKKK